MYCTKCGTKNDDDSIFCTKCGTDLQYDADKDKYTIKKDKGIFQKFGKINIKNRNVLVTIIIVSIIISAVFIFLPNIRNNYNIDNDENIGIYNNENTGIDDNIGIYNNENTGIDDNSDVPIQGVVEISISSMPSGANVYINNISKGKTPTVIELPEGNYYIKMNLTGYKGILSNFSVTYDMERQDINATFEPIDE